MHVELAEHVVEEQHRRDAGDVGGEPVPAEPERERERALLALRRVRAGVEAAHLQPPLVAVRAGERDPALELGAPAGRERFEERALEARRGRPAWDPAHSDS